ncbi:MAG: hypothetical protein WKG07_29010 [Hymenobacter sp.]
MMPLAADPPPGFARPARPLPALTQMLLVLVRQPEASHRRPASRRRLWARAAAPAPLLRLGALGLTEWFYRARTPLPPPHPCRRGCPAASGDPGGGGERPGAE